MQQRRNNSRRNDKDGDPKFQINPAMLPQVFSKRNRTCPLSVDGAPIIDYKNVALLRKFISERGKILPRRITSISAKKQRDIAKAIKLARDIALLPYVTNG